MTKSEQLKDAWETFDSALQDEDMRDLYFGALIIGITDALAGESLSVDAYELMMNKLEEFYTEIGGNR
jgi:hypothetical protein